MMILDMDSRANEKILEIENFKIHEKDFFYAFENDIFYIHKSKIKNHKCKSNIEHFNSTCGLPITKDKRFLVLVNPQGGNRKAWQSWLSLKPHFIRRCELVEELRTSRPNQINELLSGKFQTIDFIVTLGGDGFITETINVLTENKHLHIPVFPLPCGSGNGLVWSILAQAGLPLQLPRVLQAIFRFRVQPLDLMSVNVSERKFVSFLSVNLGLLADADIDSDKLRWMGKSRATLCGLWKIAKLKSYSVKMKFFDSSGGCEELDGKFVHVSIFNVSHAAKDFIAAPERKLNDRHFSAVCVGKKEVSRSQLVGAMLAAEEGKQSEKYAWLRSRDIVGFEIESSGKGFAIDGEFVPGTHITAEISDQVAYVYLP